MRRAAPPSRWSPRLGALLLVGGLIVAPTRARGDVTEPIHITYDAPAGCPDAAGFGLELFGRTARARPAEAGEKGRSFAVHIARDRRSFRGELTLREASGASSSRTVRGATCDEVVGALGLVAALAVDPEASIRPRPAPPAKPAPAVAPAAAPPRPPLPLRAPPPALHLAPAASALADAPPPLPAFPPPPRPLPPTSVRWFLGADGRGVFGLGPALMPSAALFLEADVEPRGLFAPWLRVSVAYARGNSAPAGAGVAAFSWVGARLDGCPLRVPSGPLGVAPCAGLSAGALLADGQFAGVDTQRSRPWIAADLFARGRWLLGDRVALHLEGGVSFPFVRDEFAFDPSTVIHATPPAAGFFGGGLGVRFP